MPFRDLGVIVIISIAKVVIVIYMCKEIIIILFTLYII